MSDDKDFSEGCYVDKPEADVGIKRKERFFINIDAANKKLDSYFSRHRELTKIPTTKAVVYNRVLYPIIYEIPDFYYLGGNNLYFVLKSKCTLRYTGKSHFYEIKASELDTLLGKSPIVPQGCPNNKNKVYPGDMGPLEIKV